MLELSWNGQKEIPVADGTRRSFILDGDSIVLKGYCQGQGYRVGFGECSGLIIPQ